MQAIKATYADTILNYSDANITQVAPIREKSFIAFQFLDNRPLNNLTVAGTYTGSVDTINRMPNTLTANKVLQVILDREVSRFLGADYCMGLAPPGTMVRDWVLRV